MVYMALPYWLSMSMVNFDQNREKSKCHDWVVTTQSLIFSLFGLFLIIDRVQTDHPPSKNLVIILWRKKIGTFFFGLRNNLQKWLLMVFGDYGDLSTVWVFLSQLTPSKYIINCMSENCLDLILYAGGKLLQTTPTFN